MCQVREGQPSETARRVAAYRLSAPRLPAPFGDPDADLALHHDVAGDLAGASAGDGDGRARMTRFVAGRTAFFDRVVVNGIERGATQILTVGAGYDGRSLRYSAPGVRWFEVDHPATQADKRARLGRLGVSGDAVTFIALDLGHADLRAAVVDAGWEPDGASVMLCEGVAIYLATDVLASTLAGLRALAGAGTRLAISMPRPAKGPAETRLREGIAALGEPAGNELDGAGAARVLAAAGWHAVTFSDRARQAGFVVARPDWSVVPPGRITASAAGRHLESVFHRRSADRLAHHLESTYGITVTGERSLDAGVIAVTREEGTPWIARVFPAARPVAAARGDAALLAWLARVGIDAERPAAEDAVSLHHGQAVLVTERVPGGRVAATDATYRRLGELAATLATAEVPSTLQRPGGGWHHLVGQGDPSEEVAACARLLAAAQPRARRRGGVAHARLTAALAGVDDCAGLPAGLIHPDLVPANALAGGDGAPVLIDWTGTGHGPRLWSLAFLLWSAGSGPASRVAAVIDGYRAHVALQDAELQRLPAALAARAIVLACWAAATGRRALEDAAGELASIAECARVIAGRAERALAR